MSPSVVFWTGSDRDTAGILRQSERMKDFDGGRRPTKGYIGSKEEGNRQTTEELH